MDNYWEERYKGGGNSGAGSYGEYANYKADVINNCIAKFNVKTISDFGCGDGNQIGLLKGYETYAGYDISPYAINLCINKFKENLNMDFYVYMNGLPEADLCLSLDVLYHIYKDEDFQNYMSQLFGKSKKYVLIFSTNYDDTNPIEGYSYHRKFTEYVEKNHKEFTLIEEFENLELTSVKFYLYEKI